MSPGVSLVISETGTEALDKEMARTARGTGLPARWGEQLSLGGQLALSRSGRPAPRRRTCPLCRRSDQCARRLAVQAFGATTFSVRDLTLPENEMNTKACTDEYRTLAFIVVSILNRREKTGKVKIK